MDLTASLARAAGVRPPPERPFDGIDLLERLAQRKPALPRTLFWRARRGNGTWWAVRDTSLKYVARQDGGPKREYLFDLDRDPGEKSNLLEQRGEDAARLRKLLAGWEKEVQPKR